MTVHFKVISRKKQILIQNFSSLALCTVGSVGPAAARAALILCEFACRHGF